jgi:hypothetical protein
VVHTDAGHILQSVTRLDEWGWPYNDIDLIMGETLTPLHFNNWNLSFVHTCKTLSSGPRAGERRCHSGPDTNGDGVTELISAQIAPTQPPDGYPLLSRADIWSVCSRYPSVGGPCANGGNWTAATCPQDVE